MNSKRRDLKPKSEIRDKKCVNCDNLIMRRSTWCLKCVGKATGGTKNVDGRNRGKFGEENTNWRGGKPYVYLDKHMGRICIVTRFPEGKTIKKLRSRVIMENFLGRKLTSNEVIHHIDHDKTNDDIFNLFMISRAEHQKLHKKGLI